MPPTLLCRAYEQLKLRYESLELRAQQVQAQLAAAAARAGEADTLSDRLARLQAEHATLRASTEAATGNAQGELAGLRATVAALREEVADLRSVNEVLRQQAARQPPSGAGSRQQSLSQSVAAGLGGGGSESSEALEAFPSSASLPGGGVAAGRQPTGSEDALLSPAASIADVASAQLSALADKERELASVLQRAAMLEAEVTDLERECMLRQTQVRATVCGWWQLLGTALSCMRRTGRGWQCPPPFPVSMISDCSAPPAANARCAPLPPGAMVQEAALKEAVRELEREMERQRLPGKQGERRRMFGAQAGAGQG